MNTRPVTLNTDAQFCAKVCRIAAEQGWTVDHMDTRLGHSFAFEHPDHKRVAGSIQDNREDALTEACKELLPHIYQHL